MCGIFGLISLSGQRLDEKSILNATNSLTHRGPDDSDIWINEKKTISLSHRRLAILDLNPRSKQPFFSADKKSLLTFNGEIYNYLEIKKQLSDIPFQSTSDTEVLVEFLNKFSESKLNDLDGMFAFANYKDNELLLAVDPAGKKPLYFYSDGQHFAFASEIKAFLKIPQLKTEIDKDAMALYLIYGYVPQPYSIYKYIKKLPAGHFLKVNTLTGKQVLSKYWDLPKGQRLNISYDDAKEQCYALIDQAVKKRLVADVPVGSFLSGGLDSSIVSLHAARHKNKIKTFNVGFSKDAYASRYDESLYARKVAKLIKSEHIEISKESGLYDANILLHFDEPYADSSCFPTYELCKETRLHVTVALSGDGGDELFGGYLRMRAGVLSERYKTISKILLSPFPSQSRSRQGLLAYASRYKHALNFDLISRLLLWNSFFDEDDWTNYVSKNIDPIFYEKNLWNQDLKGLELGEQILHYNFKTYLFNDLLPKVDRMSMLTSLEVRSPFLDKNLIEFAFKLPTHYKYTIRNGKKILKDLYRPYLGKGVVDRKKKGFGFPLESFFKSSENFTSILKTQKEFPSLPQQLQKLEGRNIHSKYFLLYSLEKNLSIIS